jgi:hypothetical protein
MPELEEAGCFANLKTPPTLPGKLPKVYPFLPSASVQENIVTTGIGSNDRGINQEFKPRFLRQYANPIIRSVTPSNIISMTSDPETS